MKKFLSMILVALMLVALVVPAFAKGPIVEDDISNLKLHVKAKWDSFNWVDYDLVDAFNATGFFKGEDGNGAEGSDVLTRWQFLLLMLRAQTGDLVDENWVTYFQEFGEEEIVYDDVRAILNMTQEEQKADPELFNFYQASLGAILYMMHNKFILGSADENGEINLRPNDSISFAEAVTIVVRMLGWNSTAMNYNYPKNYFDVASEIDLFGYIGEDENGEECWYGLNMDKIELDTEVTYEIAANLIQALWRCDIFDNVLGEIVPNPNAYMGEDLLDVAYENFGGDLASFEMGALVNGCYFTYKADPYCYMYADSPLKTKDGYGLPVTGVVTVKKGAKVGEIIDQFTKHANANVTTVYNFDKFSYIDNDGQVKISNIFDVSDSTNWKPADFYETDWYQNVWPELEAQGLELVLRDSDKNKIDEPEFSGKINAKRSYVKSPITDIGTAYDGMELGSKYEMNWDSSLAVADWDMERIGKGRIADNAFWAFYDLDDDGEPILDTVELASVWSFNSQPDSYSNPFPQSTNYENAWYNYVVDNGNTTEVLNKAMVRRTIGEDDTLVLVMLGDEWYFDILPAGTTTLADALAHSIALTNLFDKFEIDEADVEVNPFDVESEGDITGLALVVKSLAKNGVETTDCDKSFGSFVEVTKYVNNRVYTQEGLHGYIFQGVLSGLNAELGVDTDWFDNDDLWGDELDEFGLSNNDPLVTVMWGADSDGDGLIDFVVRAGFSEN